MTRDEIDNLVKRIKESARKSETGEAVVLFDGEFEVTRGETKKANNANNPRTYMGTYNAYATKIDIIEDIAQQLRDYEEAEIAARRSIAETLGRINSQRA